MELGISTEKWLQWFDTAREWLLTHVLIWQNLVQVPALLLAIMLGLLLGRKARRFLNDWLGGYAIEFHLLKKFLSRFLHLLPIITATLLLLLTGLGIRQIIHTAFLINLVVSLMAAWVTIQLATSLILDRFWARLVATVAWTMAALNIVGILDEVFVLLENIGFTIGSVRLTVLSVLKATAIFLALFHAGGRLSAYLDNRVRSIQELTPSTHVLLSKIIKISVMVFVVVIALGSIGIDLTALAVFSGAVGVGIGFGLQKVVGNLISGIILLLDKSVKPGDVVEIGGVYGWVNNMSGRYASVVTRDGKEYLIPNEELITQQVINWTFSDRNVRLKVDVGISYNDDPHEAMRLIVEAAKDVPRVLSRPEPRCLLKGFGDSSVDLQLRFWIGDPQEGVANVRSAVMLKIWDTLKENNIEIPFPQRDLHVRSAPGLAGIHGGKREED